MNSGWKLFCALLIGSFFIWGDYFFFCGNAGPEFFINRQ